MRIVKLIVAMSVLILSSSCYTTSYLVREVRCGIGRDYACSPTFTDNGVELRCGCLPNDAGK